MKTRLFLNSRIHEFIRPPSAQELLDNVTFAFFELPLIICEFIDWLSAQETAGSKLAASVRAKANTLTDAERKHHLQGAMAMIRGEIAGVPPMRPQEGTL